MLRRNRLLSVLLCLSTSLAMAAEDSGDVDLQQLLAQPARIDRELDRLEQQRLAVPAAAADRKVHLIPSTTYLQRHSDPRTADANWFIARVHIVNLTNRAVSIAPGDFQLTVGETRFRPAASAGDLGHNRFRVRSKEYAVSDLKWNETVTAEPGATASRWLLFTGLPAAKAESTFQLSLADDSAEIDVSAFARRQLQVRFERIGPRGGLGLVTIDGELNSLNVSALVDAVAQLTQRQVSRCVIDWSDTESDFDPQLLKWLAETADNAAAGERGDEAYPAFPTTLTVLHLSPPAAVSGGVQSAHVHNSAVDAVREALADAFRNSTRTEILHQIEFGHRLVQPAALTLGASRLAETDLPRVLQWTHSNRADMRRAAISALRHFGTQPAIDRLIAAIQSDAGPLAGVAVESLAASRYAAAQQALLDFLLEHAPASELQVLEALSRYPRQRWTPLIERYAQHDQTAIAVAGMHLLAQIGHPRLHEVLAAALSHEDAERRKAAFQLLVSSPDDRSRQLALEFTLAHLEDGPPRGEAMFEVLKRSKDPRGARLLLRHLDHPDAPRAKIIETLAEWGDQSAADVLVENYAQFSENEQAMVLEMLGQMKSPQFRPFAAEALRSQNNPLISAACRGLQADGSEAAQDLLIAALEQADHSTAWLYAGNALAGLATPGAREALQRARDSDNATKSRYAANALRSLWQRLPGYQYVFQGRYREREKQWEDAERCYDIALELTPNLPDAYASRGHLRLNRDRPEAALPDFERAVELDPHNSASIAGLAICLVADGKLDEALQRLDAARTRFTGDPTFAYNAGCVYARALEYVTEHEDTADRPKQQMRLRAQALAELSKAVELGFNDFDLMHRDRDLKSLHGLPEFEALRENASR